MRIHIDLPWGGQIEINRQPVDKDRFYAILWLIAGLAFMYFFYKLLH